MSKTKICKIFKNDLDKDIIGNGICLDTHEFRTLNYPFSGLFGFNKMLYLKRKKKHVLQFGFGCKLANSFQ